MVENQITEDGCTVFRPCDEQSSNFGTGTTLCDGHTCSYNAECMNTQNK